MRDSDPFWTFVILSFLAGVSAVIVFCALYEAMKFAAQVWRALDVVRTLSRPRYLDARRSHR